MLARTSVSSFARPCRIPCWSWRSVSERLLRRWELSFSRAWRAFWKASLLVGCAILKGGRKGVFELLQGRS